MAFLDVETLLNIIKETWRHKKKMGLLSGVLHLPVSEHVYVGVTHYK
jgi:hypothetical protein